VRAVGQGEVTGTGTYTNGETIQLEALAEPGHEFLGWSGELAGKDNPLSIQVFSDIQAIAHFRPALKDLIYIDGQPALAGSYVAKLSDTGRRSLKRRVNRVGNGRVRRSNLALDDLVSIEMDTQVKLSESIDADSLSAESLDILSAKKSGLKSQGVEIQMKEMMDSGNFEFVEPNWVVSLQSPMDAQFFKDGNSWGLRNFGQQIQKQNGVSGVDVGAAQAWDEARNLGKGILVAVIDTGVNYDHRELKSSIWRNPGEIPGNGLDDDRNGIIDDVHGFNAVDNTGDPMDRKSHGTPVAGIIAASYPLDPSSLVIPGLAPQAKIMALKALSSQGLGTIDSVVRCIDYAVANGAHIINASYGRYTEGNWGNRAEKDAIERAAQRGVLFVASAGNSQSRESFDSNLQNSDDHFKFLPAAYPFSNIISVAAVDNQGNLARDRNWASSFGQRSVDLGAPGKHIASTALGSVQSPGGISSFSGTSFAAPFVSGAAALLLGEQPGMRPEEVRTRLINSVKPLDSLQGRTVSGGMLHIGNALRGSPTPTLRLVVSHTPEVPRLGDDLIIRAEVWAGQPVRGTAKVRANLSNEFARALLDDGTRGDELQNDGTYSAIITPPNRSSIELTVEASLPGFNDARAVIPIEIVQPPANDDFANALPLEQTSQNLTKGDNTYGTTEPGEPLFEEEIGHTLWYTWRPSRDGLAKIRTRGSQFDTTLAVYTGTTLADLVQIAANDDHSDNSITSEVEFSVQTNQLYYLQIGGVRGASGEFKIHHPPPTPQLGPRPPETTKPVILTKARDYSRVEGEGIEFVVDVNGTPPFEYQWLLNSAPIDGAVFSSYSISRLALEDEGNYGVQVTNKGGFAISTLATLEMRETKLAPANDNIENAEILFGSQGQEFTVTRNATGQEGEPDHAGKSLPHHSVWWKWVAPRAGTLVLDTEGSSFDTVLAAYRLKTSTATGSDRRSRRSGTTPGQAELPNNLTFSPATSQTPARLIWPEHGLQSGDRVRIDGLLGGPTTSAEFTIHVESPDQLELLGTLGASVFNLGPSASFHKIP
jgi:subtilisin family serine protease